MSLYLCLPGI
jgi:lysophospholipase L1-like esterase